MLYYESCVVWCSRILYYWKSICLNWEIFSNEIDRKYKSEFSFSLHAISWLSFLGRICNLLFAVNIYRLHVPIHFSLDVWKLKRLLFSHSPHNTLSWIKSELKISLKRMRLSLSLFFTVVRNRDFIFGQRSLFHICPKIRFEMIWAC